MADYQKTNWQNTPSTSTPINQANLNHMEQGIYDAQHTADQAISKAEEAETLLEALQARQEAATAADMTDTSKVYIYTGSETGYNFGHWYYWNGSAWTDGGAYNSAGVNTDTTLSVSGAPADAKVAGDKITDLKSALSIYFFDDVKLLNGDKCVNTNTEFESGSFTSTNPDVPNIYVLRTVGYLTEGFYIVNPNEAAYWAVAEFDNTETFVRYISGNVPSGETNQYKDEIFYVPSPTSGHKYRIRVRDARESIVMDAKLNPITIYKKATEFNTDTTLSHSGEAADAKVTGDSITNLKNALSFSFFDDVKLLNGEKCVNTNTEFESGSFTSTDPDVPNIYVIRTVGYLTEGFYIVNPNEAAYWAVAEFDNTETFVRYITGNVFSGKTNQYKDEIFYVPSPTNGHKYRMRVRDAREEIVMDAKLNPITIYKKENGIYGYSRKYTDVTAFLNWERKSIDTSSGITDSTTCLLAKLPNAGNIEVKLNTPNAQFVIAKEDLTGDTPVYTFLTDPIWSPYFFRYTADPNYNFYVMTRLYSSGSPIEITEKYGSLNTKVYTYEDTGVYYKVDNPWYGKKIAVIGDSIVQGRFRKNGADSINGVMSKTYTTMLGEICDKDSGNFGIGGATVYGSDWKSLQTNRGYVSGYDIVLVCAGTNDFGSNVSESNFKTAYAQVLATLKLNNTLVIAMTPITRGTNNPNTGGKYLSDYATWVKDCASNASVSVIDLYSLTKDDDIFKATMPDNLHPNETGHKIIFDLIMSNIPM